ncbi:MAG TPA: argininosuccinate lyase, partial [Dissulfurispiraceae bacterium]
ATLGILAEMLQNIKFRKKRMQACGGAAYSTATDIAEYLVRKRVPFRSAHEITGRIVRYCIDNGKGLPDLSLSEYRSFSGVIDRDIYLAIGAPESVKAKKSYGGTSPEAVREQIKRFRKGLKGI